MSDQPTTPPPSEPPLDAGDTTARYPAGSPPPPSPPEAGSDRDRSRPTSAPAPALPTFKLHAVAHTFALVFIAVGLIIPLDQTMLLRVAVAWSGFALIAALVQLTPLLDIGRDDGHRWVVGCVGTVGLILFWVAVVQPYAASTAGFFLTMGVAAAAVGTFTAPHRRWPAMKGR